MDLLIINKLVDVQIENEIGRIFKRYNVVEYKSPEDGLSIDDYPSSARTVDNTLELGYPEYGS